MMMGVVVVNEIMNLLEENFLENHVEHLHPV
jgi:hypothetical protein